jgi:hypothetical protein
MSSLWSQNEIDAAVRAYLWMQRSVVAGYKPVKSQVHKALLAGPLVARSKGSLNRRFSNISSVLRDMGEQWLHGYSPLDNVGANTSTVVRDAILAFRSGSRTARRVTFLIKSIPPEVVWEAAMGLAQGQVFEYPDSTTFDAVVDGKLVAPKRVVGYAALRHYGAPLLPEDFSGGEGTPAFEAIRHAGIVLVLKVSDVEASEFRQAVKRALSNPLPKPAGQIQPARTESHTTGYARDPQVVAYVEQRANGICERCKRNAPFLRGSDNSPFLEVHHVIPLSEEGSDTVENAVALCPNCHRECHHGGDIQGLRAFLHEAVSNVTLIREV